MDKIAKCPICDTENIEEYETMDVWGVQVICEDYYGCKK